MKQFGTKVNSRTSISGTPAGSRKPARVWFKPAGRFVRKPLFFLLLLQFFSCGMSQQKQAAERLNTARSLYAAGDTLQALAQADSIGILYQGALQEFRAAKKLKREIWSRQLFRKQDELDTLNKIISRLEKNFYTEKTEFDPYTRYIHKRQNPEKRWNKSYLQVHLDARGEMSLSSNYYGETWLDHTSVRVYDHDLQARTDSVGLNSVLNHHSEFMDTRWEKVTYLNGAGKEVIEFIATHADRKLKAVFLGKRYYYIILESYDKQAAAEALSLSRALKHRMKINEEISQLEAKIGQS
ncbi:MAG: hypothetical protein AB7D05_07890 [Mangrovibacterium sp.]